MKLHFLDARGELGALTGWLGQRLTETHQRALALLDLQPIDVVVQAGVHVIPEKGHLGYAPRPGVVFVTIDPDNPALIANADASLERMFAHELHHAARWDGPGYGLSLGEALVSEGLAGHFVLELFGGLPERWECVPETEIGPHRPRADQEWEQTDYDHEAWFFGTGDLPQWLGYTLGFRIVEKFLTEDPDRRASNQVWLQAQSLRGALSM